jgi:hypothetical protein
MWGVIVDMGAGHEADARNMRITAYKKMRDELNPIRDRIAELVQARLHYNDAN